MSKKKPRRNCKNCGKECSLPVKYYCNFQCQQEFSYKSNIEAWLNGKIDGHVANGAHVSKYVRKWLISTRGNKCEKCGWDKIHLITQKVPLEVNHINGNSQDSKSENLELLCPNCHSLTPTFRNLNKGKGRKSRRSPIAAIGPDL